MKHLLNFFKNQTPARLQWLRANGYEIRVLPTLIFEVYDTLEDNADGFYETGKDHRAVIDKAYARIIEQREESGLYEAV